MKINAKAFIFHKDNETYYDCHDRLAIKKRKVCLADGATTSILAGEWAELITKEFVENSSIFLEQFSDEQSYLLDKLPAWILPIQDEWKEQILARSESSKPHLWNAILKGKSAGATFVGIEFNNSTIVNTEKNQPIGIPYNTIGIGDAMIIRFDKHGKLIKGSCFPQNIEYQFTNFPDYIDSLPEKGKGQFKVNSSKFFLEETLILASDALAKWIIIQSRNQMFDINDLWELENGIDFQAYIKKAKADNKNPINNDDTSLVILRLERNESDTNNIKNGINILYQEDISQRIEEAKAIEIGQESVIKKEAHIFSDSMVKPREKNISFQKGKEKSFPEKINDSQLIESKEKSQGHKEAESQDNGKSLGLKEILSAIQACIEKIDLIQEANENFVEKIDYLQKQNEKIFDRLDLVNLRKEKSKNSFVSQIKSLVFLKKKSRTKHLEGDKN